jgi:hypothetical protein
MTRRIAATSGDACGILEMAIKAIDHCLEKISETDRKAIVVLFDEQQRNFQKCYLISIGKSQSCDEGGEGQYFQHSLRLYKDSLSFRSDVINMLRNNIITF